MSAYSDFYDEVFEIFNKENIETEVGEIIIRDKWIKEKKYKALISFILENWSSGNCIEFMSPLVEQLAKEKQASLYKRIWKNVLKTNADTIWPFIAGGLKSEHPNITWEELSNIDTSEMKTYGESGKDTKTEASFWMKYYLNGLIQYKRGLEVMNDIDEIKKVHVEIQNIYDLKKPVAKKKKATDTRKIDETLFWSLIANSREETESQSEFLDVLGQKLSAFKSSEIKRFQKYLLTYFNNLNHWNNWALAYIVRRGCGDDGFDYFRLWIVSKGKKAYDTIMNFDVPKFKEVFDLEDPQFEEFEYFAEEIYEENYGKPMSEPRVKFQKIKGKPFSEENICKEFPKLCDIFNLNQN